MMWKLFGFSLVVNVMHKQIGGELEGPEEFQKSVWIRERLLKRCGMRMWKMGGVGFMSMTRRSATGR